VVLPAGALPLEQVREHFHEAFLGMFLGTVEADSLNRLVLTAASYAREIRVLRAYARYLRQGTSTFSLAYVEQALVANARIAALLVRLFFTQILRERQTKGRKPGGGDRRGARRSAEPRRGPDPAQLPRRDPGDHSHEFFSGRENISFP